MGAGREARVRGRREALLVEDYATLIDVDSHSRTDRGHSGLPYHRRRSGHTTSPGEYLLEPVGRGR